MYQFRNQLKIINYNQTELIKYLAGLDISFVKTNNRIVALMAISDHEILNRVIKISANLVLASSSL
jgi:deoxyinosine 3'endonuclease (endonuclease V)